MNKKRVLQRQENKHSSCKQIRAQIECFGWKMKSVFIRQHLRRANQDSGAGACPGWKKLLCTAGHSMTKSWWQFIGKPSHNKRQSGPGCWLDKAFWWRPLSWCLDQQGGLWLCIEQGNNWVNLEQKIYLKNSDIIGCIIGQSSESKKQ